MAFEPGNEIGGYRLELELGSGGFGAVWRAQHLGSGRTVAIKILTQSESQASNSILRHDIELLAGTAAAPEPPGNRVREFVLLERQALASPEQRDFWSRRIADSVFLEIPRGRAAEPADDLAERRIGFFEVAISDAVSAGVARLARSSAVPVKSVLLAVHLRALAALAGQPDVLTLMTSSGRPETSRRGPG